MDPETPPPFEGGPSSEVPELVLTPEAAISSGSPDLPPVEPYRGLRWIFIGDQGLRGGWSILVFAALFLLFLISLSFALSKIHHPRPQGGAFTPFIAFVGEALTLLALVGAAAIVARIERRSLLDYSLTGPRRVPHFFSGLAIGFAALSLLIGLLAWGGWLHFGGVALSGSAKFSYALEWACVFLLVGCAEEGMMRCYLQFTLTRTLNFWWALALVVAMCLDLFLRTRGNGVWGVYAMALLGLLPCLILHLKSAARSAAFWYAAWVTSTFFGFLHTANNGENWIGIFSAAAIGFVFCVSIRLTGSAWWAIGCHAGWDWAETYFYGTADSGTTAQGHYLITSPAGKPFWSGGTTAQKAALW